MIYFIYKDFLFIYIINKINRQNMYNDEKECTSYNFFNYVYEYYLEWIIDCFDE